MSQLIEGSESGDRAADPDPLLVARGLGLRTGQGWSYRGVDLTVDAHTVHAVVGRRGSGRSSLLLSLTGRMATSVGTLTLDGSADPKRLRALTSVARVGVLIDLEPKHTVREAIAERCLIDNVPHQEGTARFAEAAAVLELEYDPIDLVEDLTGRTVTRLAIALACVRPSHLVVLDDLERDLDSDQQTELLQRLADLAVTGPSIVVATVDQRPVDAAGIASTPLLRYETPPADAAPPPTELSPPDEIARDAALTEPAPRHGRHESPDATDEGDPR